MSDYSSTFVKDFGEGANRRNKPSMRPNMPKQEYNFIRNHSYRKLRSATVLIPRPLHLI